MTSLPEDDSCPKCGEINGTGTICVVCPNVCNDCGCTHHDSECPWCWAEVLIDGMTAEQKEAVYKVIDQG